MVDCENCRYSASGGQTTVCCYFGPLELYFDDEECEAFEEKEDETSECGDV